MLKKKEEAREQIEFISLEMMIPQNHLLRKIENAINFDKIYEIVEPLYSEKKGRPSVDPVVLFKIVMIQHIYGLPSLRRTLEEVNMNMAYRWFIGYPLNESVPHFSTVSYAFKHRFTAETIEAVFQWVLNTAAEEGYLDTSALFVDGTHIKANANTKHLALDPCANDLSQDFVRVMVLQHACTTVQACEVDRLIIANQAFDEVAFRFVVFPRIRVRRRARKADFQIFKINIRFHKENSLTAVVRFAIAGGRD